MIAPQPDHPMLDRLFSLIADIAEEPREPFQEGDYRVAAAALLVHVMTVDGVAAPVERRRLEAVLSAGFDLSDADTRRLIASATEAEVAEENWTSFAPDAGEPSGRGRPPSRRRHDVGRRAGRRPGARA
jgi:uncharacterized tellurite resistance protein B-like protein